MNKRTVFLTFLMLFAAASAGFAGGDYPVSCEGHSQSLEACEATTGQGNYCITPAGATPSVETIGKCKFKMPEGSVTPQCQCVVNQAPTRNTPLIS